MGLHWGEIITIFLTCAIKPGLAGIPAAVFGFKFSFLETLLICGGGGISGSILFSYLSDFLLNAWKKFMNKHFPYRNKHKKKFNRKNRFVIRVKKNFGIIGIAIISPLILSIPLGAFLSVRFFGDRFKTTLWLSISVTFWTVTLFFIYSYFHQSLQKYF